MVVVVVEVVLEVLPAVASVEKVPFDRQLDYPQSHPRRCPAWR
jgi:hypothetical protein